LQSIEDRSLSPEKQRFTGVFLWYHAQSPVFKYARQDFDLLIFVECNAMYSNLNPYTDIKPFP